ncbi:MULTISPECIES: alpha-glucosidase [unclassified Oceanispirochaeta]|uniref:family 4 glycosyl hydrolase n=1 Tax=unclassified Oceanispirochaeta TaxID=2635722 RepID=UPI000E096864|nr:MULTISPECIES: alpha-glucosidase [unclassified Oceanispirochaeta]MBF9014168.1 alpha-glucosidase [Oceanispirochaeta sp. M2]NPD70658.1 alpha-glucosidase [Oceanispirochaeta sp. M1]RDG34420.1 alpha-glucosidase [Oceanispirochaeta sp. M1]
MNKKIVLIGAGSAQFGLGTLGDIFCSSILKKSEITLLDINPEALKKVDDTAQAFIKKENLDFTVNSTTDRKKAFKGADFIIISIEVGDRFKLWEEDWKTPLQYGISQVYGENGGAGGVFHALRIIPPILEICRDSMEICPDAHLFCYSNPMTAITTTVHRAFPGIKFTGLCHEIASLERYLPAIMDMPFEQMDLTSGGLNHFSCLLKAKDKKTGRDIYPEIMEKAPAFFEGEPGYSDMWDHYKETGELVHTEGATGRADLGIERSAYSWADRKLFKFIMESYGLLPITGDSHFGEYLSWAWEIADHRGIIDFFDFYKVSLGEMADPDIHLEVRERIVAIMEAITTDSGALESAVNVPNNGLIADLPSWIAVEVPGTIDAQGVKGNPLGELPKGFTALLRNYTGTYDLTAEAILKENKDYVVQALLANPVVNKALPLKDLVDRMISQQGRWLSYLK